MTTNGHMECDAVEGRLLDLVYGELDADESAAVRAHASGCESCARSLAKLEGGRAIARKMSTDDAPSPVMAAVMAAARAKAGEHQRAAARQRIADAEEKRDARPSARTRAAERKEKESGGFFAELLRRLGSFATGPQVAMATLLVLMVGIGLWSAPQMTGRDTGGPSAVLEPDPDGEIGPSAGALQPAEPLHLEVDPRTDRMVDPAEAELHAETEQRPRPVVPAPPSDEGEEVVAEAAATARGRRDPAPASTDDSAEASEALAAAEQVLAPGEGVGGVQEGALPEPSGSGESAPAIRFEERPAMVAPSAPVAPSPPPPSTAPPSAMPSPPSETARVPGSGSGATARSTPGSSGARSTAPSTSGRSTPDSVEAPHTDPEAAPRGLATLARNYMVAGRYAECVRQYQRVLDQYPTYSDLGGVLLGQGECQTRLHQYEAAERTYARAATIESTRVEASRRSSQVRTMRMERDRARVIDQQEAAPAAPPEPASAY